MKKGKVKYIPMTDEEIASLKDVWNRYKTDDNYNDIGKLNLVAYLGERAGRMLAEIERLRAAPPRGPKESE